MTLIKIKTLVGSFEREKGRKKNLKSERPTELTVCMHRSMVIVKPFL